MDPRTTLHATFYALASALTPSQLPLLAAFVAALWSASAADVKAALLDTRKDDAA